ncbi:DUF3833 domain-containing protein [Sneathiella limimaris]|uniref:DUF3833 domain-containing protein n=1 Tax=Sneathiella limimaris TaxID=1964213 RepID=UPI00146D8A19|nr:DUF3833 domain-containing protein [Sneathiella limimaris]
MSSFNKKIFLLAGLLVLVGCNTMKPEQFEGTEPAFDLFGFFEGNVSAWGIFEDRFGNLRRQFTVDIDGVVDGDELTLDENFIYADGEVDRRVWKIRRTAPHKYEGRADDIVGEASGVMYGNAFNWIYEMDLQVGESTWRVKFDDWLFRQPGDVVINKATVTRWGVKIGTVTLFFKK